jgi:ABC-type oligopeptide transport system substrate-binding subunit
MVKGGDKEKMKKQIITLTAIVAILAAAIFAGCVEKETPVSNLTSSNAHSNALT